jgi:cytochrome d ubiquinol oxidase subunit II
MIFPVISTIGFILMLKASRRGGRMPFVAALIMFPPTRPQSGVIPLPCARRHHLPAAANPKPDITLIGALLILPFVLGYTIYSYWVFRGKVAEGEAGYH